MADEQTVETGQFSFSGQKYQPDEGFVDYFEPGRLDQLESNGRLYVVADGIGGMAAGALASQYAVKKVLHDFYHGSERDLEARLMAVIRKVNADIIERNNRFPERRPMGATLLAALIHRNKLWVASVGDGRVYVVWDQDIERLKEETASGEPADGPEKTAPAASQAPPDPSQRLTRLGLGIDDQIKIDVFSRRLFAGDAVVLCSGGIGGYVTDAEIAKAIGRFPPAQASRHLAEMASRRGSRDTVSFSVTRLLNKPVSQASLRPKPLPGPPDWDTLSKPAPKSQPIDTHWARSRMAGGVSMAPARWRWLILVVILLCVGMVLGVGATRAWQSWLAPETAMVTAPGDGTEMAGGAGVDEGGDQPGLASTSAPGADEEQAVVGNNSPISPLPTPPVTPHAPAAGSAGETITTTLPAGRNSVPTGQAQAATTAAPSPTPLPTIALPADCTNKGRFAGDLTVPDGQKFAPGEQFDKGWSVVNYGTCPWGPGYTIRFASGDRMGADDQGVTEVVEPDETGAFTIPMTAPDSSGAYRATWQLYSPAGEPFGPELFVEIEVVPQVPSPGAEAGLNTLYDFVENAGQATWTAGDMVYQVEQTPINRDLVIPFPQGIVAVGPAEFGGDYQVPGNVLLTHPHQEVGSIEGRYVVDKPLQPEDEITAILGFPKAAIINDDGATFEVIFKPAGGTEQVVFSRLVRYEESPVALKEPLAGVTPGQGGAFILRVRGGDSLSYDWATWIELRLVRP